MPLQLSFYHESPSTTTVYEWFPEFEEESTLWKVTLFMCPLEAIADVQVAVVRMILKEDVRVSLIQIAEEVRGCYESVSSTIKSHRVYIKILLSKLRKFKAIILHHIYNYSNCYEQTFIQNVSTVISYSNKVHISIHLYLYLYI